MTIYHFHPPAWAPIWAYLTRKTTLLIVGALLVVGIAGSYVSHTQAVRDTVKLATTHQPETFTELYFQHVNRLPVDTPAHVVRHFSFTIVNHEAKTVTYRYRVTYTDTASGKTVLLGQGNRIVNNGQRTDIASSFTLPDSGKIYLIEVQLVGRSEHLMFRSRT